MSEPADEKRPTGNLLYRRLVAALLFSLAGLRRALQEEACQVQLVILPPLIALGIWLGQSPLERVLLVCPLLAVFIVELLNTAIEITIDRISVERHELSKQAKDVGSAAVFMTMVTAAICWLIILI